MADTQNRWADFLYVMTNDSAENQVVAYTNSSDGQFTRTNAYATGGFGTGNSKVDPLSSQGSMIAAPSGRFLYVVNAGSNDISCFGVAQSGELTLLCVVPSGGLMPNSLAMHGDLLYAANSGSASGTPTNITGFRVLADGRLTRLPRARYALSTPDAKPACAVFNPSGTQLVVTELSTNQVNVYSVNTDGTLRDVTYNHSSGNGPFGATFLTNGLLLIAEAGPNALSSYTSPESGMLSTISGSILNGQNATCWVVTSLNERFAYTSNAGSSTITQYDIGASGSLKAMANFPTTPQMDGAPLDSSISRDGQRFYVLNGNQGNISVFRKQQDGSLAGLQVLQNTGLPTMGAQGMVVR